MIEPGRRFVQGAKKYLYGFNGKEKNNEISGDANSYDFGARIYDPRLGRWLSTDIVTKPFITPYNYSSNNPINYLDPNGQDNIHFIYLISRTYVDGKLVFTTPTKFTLVEKNNEANAFVHHTIELKYNGIGATAQSSVSKQVSTQFYPDVPGASTGLTQSYGFINDNDRKTLIKFIDEYSLSKQNVETNYTEINKSGNLGSKRLQNSQWWSGVFASKKSMEEDAEMESKKADLILGALAWVGADLIIGEMLGSVWNLAARERGLLIEAKAGGNLPTNFPIVDKEIGNVISSIKSIDLTAESYKKASGLKGVLNKYLKDLNNFQGATYSGKTITVGTNTTKSMELFYQTGKASKAQLKVMQEFQQAASSQGVSVTIKPIQ